MTRPRTTLRVRGLAAAATGVVVVAGCAHPAITAAGPAAPTPTAPGSSLSSAFSTPTATAAGATGSPTGSPATVSPAAAADPRVSLDPGAAASTTPYPHGRAGVPAGGLPPASTRTSPDPLVVAAAALRVFYGCDTTLDTEPTDAEKRAVPWLGGPFAAAVASAQIVAAPGAVWNAWAAHRAHLVVSLARGYDDGAPPTTPTAAYEQWVVTQTPVGTRPGGGRWVGAPVQAVVLVTLTRTGGRWQLTRLHEED